MEMKNLLGAKNRDEFRAWLEENHATNFQKFPDLYKRVRIDTIQIKRKDSALFESRLEKFT